MQILNPKIIILAVYLVFLYVEDKCSFKRCLLDARVIKTRTATFCYKGPPKHNYVLEQGSLTPGLWPIRNRVRAKLT